MCESKTKLLTLDLKAYKNQTTCSLHLRVVVFVIEQNVFNVNFLRFFLLFFSINVLLQIHFTLMNFEGSVGHLVQEKLDFYYLQLTLLNFMT